MQQEKGKISVSMMCVSIDQLLDYVKVFNEEKVDFLHVDIIDGVFAPNYTVGTDYVKQLRKLTDIPFDFHFMVEYPEEKIKWFDIEPGDQVAIHYESATHINRCLQYVADKGATPMVALNPGTPIYMLEESLDYVGGVLNMCVNPGFAGQAIVKSTIPKVGRLRKYLDDRGYSDVFIETDGNMSIENSRLVYEQGSRVFVAGTSSIIKPSAEGAKERIQEKRKAIGW